MELSLRSISVLVALSSLIGLFLVLLLSAELRKREMSILRAIGVSAPRMIFLILVEIFLLTSSAIVFGIGIAFSVFYCIQSPIENEFGLILPMVGLSSFEWAFIFFIILASLGIGVIPAYRTYQAALHDSLGSGI